MKPVYRNLIVVGLFLASVAAFWYWSGIATYLHMDVLARNQAYVKELVALYPLRSLVVYLTIFFIGTLSAIPITLIMTIVGGFLFGWAHGLLYAFIALMCGSIVTFIAAKNLFGIYFQERYGKQLVQFNENFARYGIYYLIVVRCIPVLPLFVVNVAAGLTRIDLKTFVLATAVGILPLVVMCVWAGSQGAAFFINW